MDDSFHETTLLAQNTTGRARGPSPPFSSYMPTPNTSNRQLNAPRGVEILDWSNVAKKVYERDEQQSRLHAAYRKRKTARNSELYLITGESGTGKTTLATSIKEQVIQDGGFFCSGKFVQASWASSRVRNEEEVGAGGKPYDPFLSVLKELAAHCLRLDKVTLTELQHHVAMGIGAEVQVLLDAVPGLKQVFPPELFAMSTFVINKLRPSAVGNSSQADQVLGRRQSSFGNPVSSSASQTEVLHPRSTAAGPPPRLSSGNGIAGMPRRYSNTGPLEPNSSSRRMDISTGTNATNARSIVLESNTGLESTPPKNHFAVVFKRFLRLVCCQKRPLVLFLDDLQRGDPLSLELVEMLLQPLKDGQDDSQQGLMVVATCRANEVQLHHPLARTLRRMEDEGVKILETKVPNLGLEALSQMIADIIRLPPDECTPLAEIVLRETKGNVLFVKRYIQSLHEDEQDGILTTLSPHVHKNSTEGRIVQLLARQIKRLPKDVQHILLVASCLGGGEIREKILCLASGRDDKHIRSSLVTCCDRNIMEFNIETNEGRFSHDKYQEAALSLLPSTEHKQFHLTLGRRLQEQLSLVELSEHIGLVVELMSVGIEYLQSDSERQQLAQLCLQAGQQIRHTCSFVSATDYMERGIALLSARRWQDQYTLSLALYNAAADLAYCHGNHERVTFLVDEVKANARTSLDQLQACMTSMLSLDAVEKSVEAIAIGFGCLARLGYPLPRGKFQMDRDFGKTQRALQKVSQQQILDLHTMEDANLEGAMKVLEMLHTLGCTTCPDLTPLLGSKMVRLTLKHGLCQTSPIGFAFYALTLMRIGSFEEAHVYGHLAMKLLERHSTRSCSVKVFLTVSIGPILAKKAHSEAMDLMKKAHHLGLQTGDIETALRAATCHSALRMYMGEPLWSVAKSLRDTIHLCDDYGNVHTISILRSYLSACMHLMGSAAQESFNREFVSSLVSDSKSDLILVYTLYAYFYLAMYLKGYSIAEVILGEIKARKKISETLLPFCQMYQTFCEAVVAAAQGRSKGDKLRIARKKLSKLRKHGLKNHDNIWNKVCLIEGELEACAGRVDSAILKYDKAMQLAEKQGFVNEQALACEKAGTVLLEAGRISDSEWYMTRSRHLYKKWGANAKVEQLVDVSPSDNHPKCYITSGSGGSLQTE